MSESMGTLADIIAEDFSGFESKHVHEAIRLIENDNTIPFIARYRRVQTGGMDAEVLRELKSSYENIKSLRNKVDKIIAKDGNSIPKSVQESLTKAKTLDEVDDLYAPFKKGGKGTLAERARSLGLEVPAQLVLKSPEKVVTLNQYIKTKIEGLQTLKEIETGIQHIIADIISKDEDLNSTMKTFLDGQVTIECKTTEAKMKADKDKKFQNYYDFSMNTSRIKSHQILAINRGEEQKVLTVRVLISDWGRNGVLSWLNKKWIPYRTAALNKEFLAAAIDDSFRRLIEKKFLRRVRARLTATAEREAVEVFSRNLKKLFLAPPVRGKNTIGIDPGFKHGCKVAALDCHGQVLETAVVHPFGASSQVAKQILCGLVKRHRCVLIAIGNGTACRETETFVSNMIKKDLFKPTQVTYCIVNESGASVWSVSKEAQAELPNLDPNLRSAVSVGRRLQDPLLELVKIEPKHIGVGMYQHDVNENLLKGALEGVIEDCVSFVGVDLNACSAALLRRIAGVGIKKAETIINWREKHGPFINRKQLLLVKGLGNKCFEQCAGFVRVNPTSLIDSRPCEPQTGKKRKSDDGSGPPAKKRKGRENFATPELLDQTMIHPETYAVAYQLMNIVGATADMIGSPRIAGLIDSKSKTTDLVEKLQVDEETFSLIKRGLTQPLGFDLRSEMEHPSFDRSLSSIDDLVVGQLVSGVVSNVTPFGVFIDFGIEKDGLIHKNNLGKAENIGPGDRCDCFVVSIEKARQRIGLKLKCMKSAMPVLR